METLTHNQAAALYGVSARRFYQICNEPDPPPKDVNGKYPAKEFGNWLRMRHGGELGVLPDGEILDLNAERARLAKAQADKTELEVSQLRCDLIPHDLVIATWQAHVASARARLLSLPTKTAHVVIAATSLTEIETAIKKQVYEALSELDSDGLPESVRTVLERNGGRMETAAKSDGESVGGQVSTPKRRKRSRAGSVAN